MEPPLIRGGNSRKPTRASLTSASFNGAAPDQRRKQRLEVTNGEPVACFNGAAPDQRRKPAGPRRLPRSTTRFNGAAPDQRRKRRPQCEVARVPLLASMEPPLIRGGNSITHNSSVFKDLTTLSRAVDCQHRLPHVRPPPEDRFLDFRGQFITRALTALSRTPHRSRHRVSNDGYSSISAQMNRASRRA